MAGLQGAIQIVRVTDESIFYRIRDQIKMDLGM